MGDAMNGFEKLTPSNHTLWRRVQHLVRMGKSWEEIAFMVDVPNVMDLCNWVLEYKSPKADVMKNTGYVHTVPVKVDYKPDSKTMTDQFIAWKRQRDGAEATLREIVCAPE